MRWLARRVPLSFPPKCLPLRCPRWVKLLQVLHMNAGSKQPGLVHMYAGQKKVLQRPVR